MRWKCCFSCALLFLTPYFCHPSTDKFVVITPAKSGTHLLISALCLMTDRKQQEYLSWPQKYGGVKGYEREAQRIWDEQNIPFFHYSDAAVLRWFHRQGWHILTIVRDPRDQLVSRVYFKSGEMREFVSKKEAKALLRQQIVYDKPMYGALPMLLSQAMLNDIESGRVCKVHFEDLVGPQGGGTEEKQLFALRRVDQFLELGLSEESLLEIAPQLFGHKLEKVTFRKGQIGGWREYFDKELEDAYERRFGDYAHRIGYGGK